MKYYAVRKGRKTGIFLSWDEAKTYVSGYPGAQYKSFATMDLAQSYLKGDTPITPEKKEKEEEIEIKYDNGRLKVYTDGSCISGVGGYGYVYVGQNENKDESYHGKIPGYSTNQVAELYAIQKALSGTNVQNIDLYTDSKYSIGCLTDWHPNWNKNGWKNAKGEMVANKELIQSILFLLRDKNVRFFHVYGHKGDFYNEMCDKLANMGRLCEFN